MYRNEAKLTFEATASLGCISSFKPWRWIRIGRIFT